MRTSIWILCVICIFLFSKCGPKTEYGKLVQRELASNEYEDSLFAGLHFEMKKQDFIEYSKKMNLQGVFHAAPDYELEYRFQESLKYPAKAIFYPAFENRRIDHLTVTFRYQGWSPLNRDLQSDRLMEDLLSLYKTWYDEEFITATTAENQKLYIRVDGNRQIGIAAGVNGNVKVVYENLRKQKKNAKK